MTPCDHPIEQPYEHPYPEEVDLCPKCGNWMPLLVVTASRADRQPHPDESAPTAQIPAVPTDLAASAPDRAADVAGTTGPTS